MYQVALPASWSDAVMRVHGVPEVTIDWVLAHRKEIRLVDIRERFELVSELGAIDDVENVPFSELGRHFKTWDREAPIALICRSGARSAHAAMAFEQAGFRRVASVQGGMLAYHAYVQSEGGRDSILRRA